MRRLLAALLYVFVLLLTIATGLTLIGLLPLMALGFNEDALRSLIRVVVE